MCYDCYEYDRRHKEAKYNVINEKDFTDEVRWPKSSKKVRPKKKPGCPGNDGKAHVYVWVPHRYTLWSGREYVVEYKTCCGCEKRAPGRSYRYPK